MTPDEKLQAAVRAVGGERDAGSLEALKAAAHAELQTSPKVRAWWVDGVVLLAVNVALGVAASMMMSSHDVQHAASWSKYAIAACWFVFMAVASLAWLRPGGGALRWAVAGGFIVVALGTLAGLSGADPGGSFWNGVSCAIAECKVAAIPAILVVAFSLRFAARPMHVLVGGLAAASGGAVALHFHCPNGTLAHVAMFHLLPALVLGVVMLGVRRFLPSRSYVP